MIRNAPNDIALGQIKAMSLLQGQEQALKANQEAQRQRELTQTKNG